MNIPKQLDDIYNEMSKVGFKPYKLRHRYTTKPELKKLLGKFHPNKIQQHKLDPNKSEKVTKVLTHLWRTYRDPSQTGRTYRNRNPSQTGKRQRNNASEGTQEKRAKKRAEYYTVVDGFLSRTSPIECMEKKYISQNLDINGRRMIDIIRTKKPFLFVDVAFQGHKTSRYINLDTVRIDRSGIVTVNDLFNWVVDMRVKINKEINEKTNFNSLDINSGFYIVIKNFVFQEKDRISNYEYKPNVYFYRPNKEKLAGMIEPWASVLVVVKDGTWKTEGRGNPFWKPR